MGLGRRRLPGRTRGRPLGYPAAVTAPSSPPPARDRARRLAARAGTGAGAFAVFLCGWLAMHAETWVGIVGFSLLALLAAAVASAFSRRAS